MTARRFTIRWLLALLMLTAFIVVFPYLLPPLVRATGCASVGGACGAMALVFGIFLRLPAVIGFGIYLAFLTWKRSQLIGINPWICVFVLLIYAANTPFLFAFGNFWAASFAIGLGGAGKIGVLLPVLAMLLAALIALSCLPDGLEAKPNPARTSAFAAGGLALFVTSTQWLQGLMIVPFVGRLLWFLFLPAQMTTALMFGWTGGNALLLVAFAFVASLIWWVKAARRPVVLMAD